MGGKKNVLTEKNENMVQPKRRGKDTYLGLQVPMSYSF